MMSSQDDPDLARGTKPFVEHLHDLRKAIVAAILFAACGIGVAIPLSPVLLSILKRPLALADKDPATFLRVLEVTGGVAVAMRLSLWGGLVIAAPFIAWTAAWFIFPGLTRRERRAALRAAAFSVVLFAAGILMCYFMTLPPALRFMFYVNELVGVGCEFINVSDYLSFTLMLLLAFGLTFQFPVILLALGSLGFITSDQLRDKRRHVIVAIFVVSMIVTPPDVLSQVLMAIPLTVLYELCIWIMKAREIRAA